jgi:hypothetical protein
VSSVPEEVASDLHGGGSTAQCIEGPILGAPTFEGASLAEVVSDGEDVSPAAPGVFAGSVETEDGSTCFLKCDVFSVAPRADDESGPTCAVDEAVWQWCPAWWWAVVRCRPVGAGLVDTHWLSHKLHMQFGAAMHVGIVRCGHSVAWVVTAGEAVVERSTARGSVSSASDGAGSPPRTVIATNSNTIGVAVGAKAAVKKAIVS